MKCSGEGYWKYTFDLRFHPEAGSDLCNIFGLGDPQSLYHSEHIIIVGGRANLRTGEAWWTDLSDQPYPKYPMMRESMQVLSKGRFFPNNSFQGDFVGVAMHTPNRYDEIDPGPCVVQKIGTYSPLEYKANTESTADDRGVRDTKH